MTNIILCATIKWYEASCCLFFSALLFHPLILCFMVVWGIRELGAALEIQLKHNAVLESSLWKLSHGWWLCEKALVRKHFFFFSLLTSACIWPYLSPHTLLWEWTISRYDYTQVWTHRNTQTTISVKDRRPHVTLYVVHPSWPRWRMALLTLACSKHDKSPKHSWIQLICQSQSSCIMFWSQPCFQYGWVLLWGF